MASDMNMTVKPYDYDVADALFPILFRTNAVRCNCRTVDRAAVLKTAREILEMRMEDYNYLLRNNLDQIVQIVKDQKEGK